MTTSKTAVHDVYVVDGSRSPFLKAKGKPGPFTAANIAVSAARPLLARMPFSPSDIDEVIAGCVMPGPDEANIARVVALRLGCDEHVPAWTVQRNCASGLQALDCAATNIATGRSGLVLAGGIESMSHAPVLLAEAMVAWLGDWYRIKSLGGRLKALGQLRPAYFKPIIALLRGLTDPVVGLSMGQTAEVLAHRFNINREAMDSYAARSHARLAAAQDQGFLGEIETIYDTSGKFYKDDDGLRRDSSVEQLAKLKPVFDRPFGDVTAGNSAQVTDGSAWLVLANAENVEKFNLPVLGKILDSEWAGLDPSQMGLGPVHAMTPILQRRKMKLSDVDYWEINEAFAAQVLANLEAWKEDKYCSEQLGLTKPMGELDQERLNVDGGGVSIGHPVGASGARIVLHLLHVLKRNNAKTGMASLCIGGGQGGAMLLESCSGVGPAEKPKAAVKKKKAKPKTAKTEPAAEASAEDNSSTADTLKTEDNIAKE
ncbi:MAG: acetyl-CoA C-acetyltransferase [Gammaproteobacteria bacterium]|nr:acetyl-CoA C-acetyltransferase [Gammaproteobacteria bacterium]MDH5803334.1 acetyl-CoA C-acetyltransferase [Gammaproteobacteria bacterium]